MGYRTVPVPLFTIHKSGVEIGKPRGSRFDFFVEDNFFNRVYLENG